VTVGTHEENDLFLEVFRRAIEPGEVLSPGKGQPPGAIVPATPAAAA
jgi:hypothetical protein